MTADARAWTGAALLGLVLAAAAAGAAPTALRSLELRQGTDISVTAAPGGARVMELGGRLWRLPETGGAALAITPADEYDRRPTFSPDGSTLAYESLRDGHFQLVLADADGGNPRQVTSGPWQHLSPAWSADGQRLALAADRGGDFGIWVLEPATGALGQITFDRGDELDPAWEPAGAGLAYVSDMDGRSALVLRTPGQPRRVLVENGQRLRGPAWRPDGSVVSYVAMGPQGGRLNMVILSAPPVVKPLARGENAFTARAAWIDRNHFLYAADGQLRQREFGALGAAELPFSVVLDIRTATSPPARRLPVAAENQPVRGLAGAAPLPNGHIIVSALGDLWEIGADGGLVRAVTQDAFVDRDPAVSADGRWLAYTSDRGGRPQVWLRDLTGGTARPLTATAGDAGHPALDAAGKRVAFLADGASGDTRQSLQLMDIATGTLRPLAEGLVDAGTPAWSPDDSQVALVQEEGGNRRLLLFATSAAGGLRRLTLPAPAAAPGLNEVTWSAAGNSLAIASAAGIRVLPVLANGLVGADWQSRYDGPVQLARWVPGTDDLLFTDAQGLMRLGAGGDARRVEIALSWRPAQAEGRTIIHASRVFDGGGEGYLYNQKVVIEGNRVVALDSWSDAGTEGATLIDARGKTVVPGLIDLGLQLSDAAGERLGRTLLAFGVTTAQVAAGPGAELREVAERWQSHAAGPRLVRSPEWCGGDAPANGAEATVSTGALRLCPTRVAQSGAAWPAPAGAPIWSASWLAAGSGLVSTISTFRPGPRRPADEVLPAGPSPYQDAMEVMVQSGAAWVPDLAARGLPLLADSQATLLASPQYLALFGVEERRALADDWRTTMASEGQARRTWLRDTQRLIGRFVAGGGRLAAASGAPAAPNGLGLHAELRLLANAGLPNATVLRAATGEAARTLGLQDDLGRIAPGQLADILVIDGDPLANIDQLLQIEAVVIDGALRPMDALVQAAPATPALEKFTPAPRPAKPKQAAKRR